MAFAATIDRVLARYGRLRGSLDCSPRYVAGKEPPVLALHGFGAGPADVDLVVGAASELGLLAHAPLLPGHGAHAREFAASRWCDWYDAAAQGLADLTRDRGPAVVVGLSLGAVLGVHLAALHPTRVKGLALLANALWLRHSTELLLTVADRLGAPNLWVPKLGSDIRDPRARRTQTTYRVQPLRAGIDLLRAARRARRLLTRVRCPALIAHGALDRVCPVDNARRIAAALPNRDQQLLLLPRSGHIITRDLDQAELRDALLSFMRHLREPHG